MNQILIANRKSCKSSKSYKVIVVNLNAKKCCSSSSSSVFHLCNRIIHSISYVGRVALLLYLCVVAVRLFIRPFINSHYYCLGTKVKTMTVIRAREERGKCIVT